MSPAVSLALLLVARLIPPRFVLSPVVLCPIGRLTGRPCPTCGLTRSVVLAAHGDIRGALKFHAFGPATILALCAGALGLLRPRLPERAEDTGSDERPSGHARRFAAFVVSAVWLAYVVWRAISSGGRRWPGAECFVDAAAERADQGLHGRR